MRLWIFAIGGTGARVLKSLVMLSAAGVKPLDANSRPLTNFEIVPIIIDPHKANEDLKRCERLLGWYRLLRHRLHGDDVDAEGFFANKISLLSDLTTGDQATRLPDSAACNMSAVEHSKFREYINYNSMNEPCQALTSLLFADYQLENKMRIGFVGSPNIGSVALNQIKDSDEFHAFANEFRAGDRIFFISSIFGGTGAAGFPILVKNIRHAEQLDVSNKDVLRRAPIGALTVLPYFNIEHSDDSRINRADFVVKTQSALHYYNKTLTKDSPYAVNALFYVGDQVSSKPYAYDPGENGQRNHAHLVELVGAMSVLRFAGISSDRLIDQNGNPLPTLAFEYGLEKDVTDLSFSAFGAETRRMVFKPMVKFHLLMLFIRSGLKAALGRGFTEDSPKITSDFFATEFFRVLDGQMLRAYGEWLGEMRDNMRSVHLFSMGDMNMNTAIQGLQTKKRSWPLGRATISCDTFIAQMNRLSRSYTNFTKGQEEKKLFYLFNKAADVLVDEKYENIN
ncbi:MAG: hypothetical protein ACI308_10525 [Muribaculaceae bacterium]